MRSLAITETLGSRLLLSTTPPSCPPGQVGQMKGQSGRASVSCTKPSAFEQPAEQSLPCPDRARGPTRSSAVAATFGIRAGCTAANKLLTTRAASDARLRERHQLPAFALNPCVARITGLSGGTDY